ncbi:MAG: LacI family transcriptional regulator, partial [Actinomycetia bacterium]|nr:LacI family transcriptional regulator [Actinomycetes bacterium]
MSRQKQPLIGDVAKAASVSVATVSRALRDDGQVAVATRARVLAVAEQLGYVADPHASRLRSGRHHTVGLVAPRLHWYLSRIVLGVERVLHTANHDLLLIAIETPKRQSDFLEAASKFARRVDGLLLVDLPSIDGAGERLGGLRTPIVTVGMTVDGRSSITIPNRRAAREATDHLIQLGHRRIGLISVGETEPDGTTASSVVERLAGYRHALAAASIDFRPELVVEGDWSPASGQAAMAQLLDLAEPPTAVFVVSDEMAFGAVAEASRLGLSVPGDLSVVGFDDHDLSEVMGLTTVRQSVDKLGEEAARLLLDQVDRAGQAPEATEWALEL